MTSPAAMAELAMIAAAPSGAVREPGPGEVLVVAIAPHKVGPPPRTGVPDTRAKYWPGQQYVCAEGDARHAQARGLVHTLTGITFDWWGAAGRVLSPFDAGEPYTTRETPGALRIAQGVGYDPGSAAYRFHAALNAASKHASGFIRWGDTNPHSSYRQVDGETDAAVARDMVLTADVLHNHIGYFLLNNTRVQRRPEQVLVMHYHGSRPDGKPLCGDRMPGAGMSYIEWDATRGAHVVGARLQLCDEITAAATATRVAITPEWLPIPVPVAEYAALVTRPAWDGRGPFRIAHSPTNRRFKGSDIYDTVVARLRSQGLPIEPVTIMGLKHGDALRLKATCHATFDSFWLGMQGSGLEAAAMGQPVLAGDADAAEAHRAFCGDVPWTFAPDERALGEAIERLVTDPAYYAAESARVGAFVAAHHDYPAVARRYEALLAKWTGRADVFTEAPAVAAPKPRRKRKAA